MRCMVNRKGNKKIYRLVDLARRLDRDKTTLLRWEAEEKFRKPGATLAAGGTTRRRILR